MLVRVPPTGRVLLPRPREATAAATGNGYVIEDGPHGRTLVVTGRWSRAAERALAGDDVDGLALQRARGFEEGHVDFLDAAWGLRRLNLLDHAIADLAPVERLGGSLLALSAHAAPAARLRLGALPGLETVAGDWAVLGETMADLPALRAASVWGFDEPTLRVLAGHAALQRLTVKDSPALRDLSGVERLAKLRELEVEACPGIDALDPVGSVHGLTFLGASDCADIASLRPLGGLTALEVLHAWGSTRIVDGDLSPLAALPRLREIRMRDRCCYQPRVSDCRTTPRLA
jgi:hypothetical protein